MDVTQKTYHTGEKNCDPFQSNMTTIMIWKQLGNSLTKAHVLAEINRDDWRMGFKGWLDMVTYKT